MHEKTNLSSIEIVLGFDFGTKRIGVAVGNSLTKTAQALSVINNTNQKECFTQIENLISEWQPNLIAVGLPFYPDDAEHPMKIKVIRFGDQIHDRFKLPVQYVDERYTSALLERDPNYQKRLDSHAAALILEQYFRERS